MLSSANHGYKIARFRKIVNSSEKIFLISPLRSRGNLTIRQFFGNLWAVRKSGRGRDQLGSVKPLEMGFSPDGYITDQDCFSTFRYRTIPANYNGCGWIAASPRTPRPPSCGRPPRTTSSPRTIRWTTPAPSPSIASPSSATSTRMAPTANPTAPPRSTTIPSAMRSCRRGWRIWHGFSASTAKRSADVASLSVPNHEYQTEDSACPSPFYLKAHGAKLHCIVVISML